MMKIMPKSEKVRVRNLFFAWGSAKKQQKSECFEGFLGQSQRGTEREGLGNKGVAKEVREIRERMKREVKESILNEPFSEGLGGKNRLLLKELERLKIPN